MSILLGSQHVYTKQKCIRRDPKLTVSLSRILSQIKKELLKFNIKVQRPLKKDLPFCNSLWVRDPFINVNNKLLMLPLEFLEEFFQRLNGNLYRQQQAEEKRFFQKVRKI